MVLNQPIYILFETSFLNFCSLEGRAEDFFGFEELAGDFGRRKAGEDRIYGINWIEEFLVPNPILRIPLILSKVLVTWAAAAVRLKPMSFEKLSYLAQMVASVGVIVSLIFVGLQIRQNTGALQRNEHNSTMAQWTVIRMAIAKKRAGKCVGVLPHLGENAARYFSKGDLRIDGWASHERAA